MRISLARRATLRLNVSNLFDRRSIMQIRAPGGRANLTMRPDWTTLPRREAMHYRTHRCLSFLADWMRRDSLLTVYARGCCDC